ncbi:hypothetical protein VE02_07591 [Pseudogymnoascus sp. 03VT05]|nr:hypothetical protein VE00_09410 [Pseudogymnoascus sp. WSF 3629]OBT83266.1 hypothetical protein VE02_07591 [Pseudogymnoascus sp. 03VT05]
MLDHTGFAVPPSQYEAVIAFYTAALAPLGITPQMNFPGQAVGFGPSKAEARFWVSSKEGATEKATAGGVHVAFKAADHEAVQKFHEEGLKAGGTCNGKPGIRATHPSYYASFVLDPLGNNIEAVDHIPRD